MMVWILVWAGLLIMVLYSPIGSPDLYTSSNYYVINRTVSAENGTILNTPKRNFESDNYSNDAELPEITSASASKYSAGNYQSPNVGSQGSTYYSQTQSYQNNNSSGTGYTGSGGSSIFSGGGSHGNTGSSGITMTNGITTLSLTTNMSNTGLTKESATTYTTGTGGTDPGGDPTGDPIPVGDGWVVFIALGVMYSFFKVFNTNKQVQVRIKVLVSKIQNILSII